MKRDSGPTYSPTQVRNAITSCLTSFSISRILGTKKSAFFSVGGSSSLSLSIPRGVPQMRARRRLSTSHSNSDGDDDDDNTINVLSTRTETSMSSTSFSIPRRTTIEADVCRSIDFFFH